MGTYGSLSPGVERYGGGSKRLQRLLESLNKAMGSAYDVTEESVIYIENLAIARILDGMWSTNKRAANEFDPYRMNDLLPRWEAIMQLFPRSGDSKDVRRSRIATAFSLFSRLASAAYITSRLASEIGLPFVSIEAISPSIATVIWPPNPGDGTIPWRTNVANILIRTQTPPGWTEGMYQAAISRVSTTLDPLVPAWTTWTVYRPGPTNYPVTGGPSAAGFYLDTPLNLDNQLFGR